jgi:hypothetical protein
MLAPSAALPSGQVHMQNTRAVSTPCSGLDRSLIASCRRARSLRRQPSAGAGPFRAIVLPCVNDGGQYPSASTGARFSAWVMRWGSRRVVHARLARRSARRLAPGFCDKASNAGSIRPWLEYGQSTRPCVIERRRLVTAGGDAFCPNAAPATLQETNAAVNASRSARTVRLELMRAF